MPAQISVSAQGLGFRAGLGSRVGSGSEGYPPKGDGHNPLGVMRCAGISLAVPIVRYILQKTLFEVRWNCIASPALARGAQCERSIAMHSSVS